MINSWMAASVESGLIDSLVQHTSEKGGLPSAVEPHPSPLLNAHGECSTPPPNLVQKWFAFYEPKCEPLLSTRKMHSIVDTQRY